VNAQELHRIVATRLRHVGQRYTVKRRQLVELLRTADQPMHIPDILKSDESLAQSSVYRNLSVLLQAGVVQRIVTNDPFGRYELACDLTDHHHHLICSRCGTVKSISVPDSVESVLDGTLADVASAAGYRLTQHRLDLVGLCGECA
jgi:Fur family transcriptional regulator, ferric uptake regulator